MTHDDYNLNRTQREAIRRHPTDADRLPQHPETWTCHDVNVSRQALATFSRHGLINSVGMLSREEHPGGSSRIHRWQTTPDIAEFIDQYHHDNTLTPCGCSTGFRTLTSGETYTCRNTECTRTFDRETAEAVANNDPLPHEHDADREAVADGGTTCPDCGGVLAYRAGCTTCLSCGYSRCGGGDRR